MGQLEITDVSVESRTRLRVEFDCTSDLEPYFAATEFVAEYDITIDEVPESLLVIPALANICTIVWANQSNIYVDEIDERFLASLQEIQQTFRGFYPDLDFSGDVHATEVTQPDLVGGSRRMMLFSGGVDSIATYIRRRHENPILVSVYGSGIVGQNPQGWDSLSDDLRGFAGNVNSEFHVIRANLRSMLDEERINAQFGNHVTGKWWGGVQHGAAMLGLSAPITNVLSVGQLYLASSYTIEFSEPWGSDPQIDNNVRWAGTIASHDGYNLSRQDKIGIIAEYIRNDYPSLLIRSCMSSERKANCSRCEKCSRTIMGLELEGLNPSRHGYRIDPDTFMTIQEKLTNGIWNLGEDERFMWKDIQNHADTDHEVPHSGAEKLLKWLVDADIDKMIRQSRLGITPWGHVLLRIQRLPYPLYRSIVSAKRLAAE